MELSKDLLQEMLRRMWLIRRFEEASEMLVDTGEIGGEVHLSIGQEAEIVGACLALQPDDYMTGNHRSHGHPIAKGGDLPGLMAELMGKATGVCKGKGGSMHLADFSVGSLGESGIVASAIPVAAGAGLSAQYLKNGRVCLCFFGDGAVNEGAFHEGLNLASIWDLPVVFMCENNQYAVTMTSLETTAVKKDLAERAAAYDMPGVVVDGQDVVKVYETVKSAVDRARSGDGPSFIEAKTYRFDEHAYLLPISVPYRTQTEIEEWKRRDPILLFQERLSADQLLTDDEIAATEVAASREIDEAVELARRSPEPPPEFAFDDMYANPLPIRRAR